VVCQAARVSPNNQATFHHVNISWWKSKKCGLKTLGGRGRKRVDWVEWLHGELLTEFERLSSMGVKFSYDLLRLLAQGILDESKHDTFNTKYIDPKDKKQ
jgi:hypothetical protein